jgi:hypothetical protein
MRKTSSLDLLIPLLLVSTIACNARTRGHNSGDDDDSASDDDDSSQVYFPVENDDDDSAAILDDDDTTPFTPTLELPFSPNPYTWPIPPRPGEEVPLCYGMTEEMSLTPITTYDDAGNEHTRDMWCGLVDFSECFSGVGSDIYRQTIPYIYWDFYFDINLEFIHPDPFYGNENMIAPCFDNPSYESEVNREEAIILAWLLPESRLNQLQNAGGVDPVEFLSEQDYNAKSLTNILIQVTCPNDALTIAECERRTTQYVPLPPISGD